MKLGFLGARRTLLACLFFASFSLLTKPALGNGNNYCKVVKHRGQTWIKLNYIGLAGHRNFDFRIGNGGEIAELRDAASGFSPLLAPSYKGEQTDRVIQTVIWSPPVQHKIPSLPPYEWRWNINQAGNFNDQRSIRVSLKQHYDDRCTVDVYSIAPYQWKSEQQRFMNGEVSSLTRYSINPLSPQIVVDKYIVVGPTRAYQTTVGGRELNGMLHTYPELLIEQWIPLTPNRFNAVALSLNNGGYPNWWYRYNYNIPGYPGWTVNRTQGYAVAYNEQQRHAVAFAVVYGKKAKPNYVGKKSHPKDVYKFAPVDFDGVLTLLPDLFLHNISAKNMIHQQIVLYPKRGLSAGFATNPNYS